MQQLILDIQKIGSIQKHLDRYEKGYADLSAGYGMVKGIAQGNFNLHEVFFRRPLFSKSSGTTICKGSRYNSLPRKRILSEYKTAYNSFAASNKFNPHELDYVLRVYNQLTKQALQNVTNLFKCDHGQ